METPLFRIDLFIYFYESEKYNRKWSNKLYVIKSCRWWNSEGRQKNKKKKKKKLIYAEIFVARRRKTAKHLFCIWHHLLHGCTFIDIAFLRFISHIPFIPSILCFFLFFFFLMKYFYVVLVCCCPGDVFLVYNGLIQFY